MAVEHLFTLALGLASRWKVITCDFDPLAKMLKLVIDFEREARFADPETGEACPVHDTVQRSWEHLRFFEYRMTIRARVPVAPTPSGAVKTVEVPWARPAGGFTLLMEAYLLTACRQGVEADFGQRGPHLALALGPPADQRGLAASRLELLLNGSAWMLPHKGHKYGTVFLEISGKETARGRGAYRVARLLFFTPGKDKETFTQFASELERRSVPVAQDDEIAKDMSNAFIAGATEHFPEAQFCFGCFHVMKLCGESLEAIRKGGAPWNMAACHSGAMWALRGNSENL